MGNLDRDKLGRFASLGIGIAKKIREMDYSAHQKVTASINMTSQNDRLCVLFHRLPSSDTPQFSVNFQ